MAHPDRKHLLPNLLLIVGLAACNAPANAQESTLPPPQISVKRQPASSILYSCIDTNYERGCSPQEDIMLPNVPFQILVDWELISLQTNDKGEYFLPYTTPNFPVPLPANRVQEYGETFCLDEIWLEPGSVSAIYQVCNLLPSGPELNA